MLNYFNKKGQSVVEYTVIMIIVLGAFVAMSSYIKRGLQGRWRESSDSLGDQYDPRYGHTNSRHIVMQNSATQIRAIPDSDGTYWTFREDTSNTVTVQDGYIGVDAH